MGKVNFRPSPKILLLKKIILQKLHFAHQIPLVTQKIKPLIKLSFSITMELLRNLLKINISFLRFRSSTFNISLGISFLLSNFVFKLEKHEISISIYFLSLFDQLL